MTIKLDIMKAHDKVEWPFLQQVFLTLGFPPSWFGWWCHVLRRPPFLFLWTGRPHEASPPPAEFVKAVYCLPTNSFLSQRVSWCCYRGLRWLGACLMSFFRLGVLLSLAFCWWLIAVSSGYTRSSPMSLNILWLYEQASGQKVNLNLHKSAIFFSPSIPQVHRSEIQDLMGIRRCLTEDVYLGFPWLLGRRKAVSWISWWKGLQIG